MATKRTSKKQKPMLGVAVARVGLVPRSMRPVTVTQDDVIEFWRVMMEHYGATLIDKTSDADMKIVADALNAMGIMDRERFLTGFTTTIGTKIYAPFTPGTPIGGWNLWNQITVCTHECYHIAQSRQFEGIEFGWRYITSATARAYYEVEAYRSDMVLNWRYQNATLNPALLAGVLRDGYACPEADVRMAEKMFRLSLISIKKGAIPGEVTQFACNWLDARWNRK